MPRTRHPYAPEPLPRPLLLRILSITAISLPPLLSLITFALTLKIIYTPEYAEAKLHTSTGRPNGLVIHTSPFYNCTKAPLTAIDDPTTTTFTPTCVRLKSLTGAKATAACHAIHAPPPLPNTTTTTTNNSSLQWDPTPLLCQALVTSASLYIAAAAISAFALVLSTAYCIAAWPAALAARERFFPAAAAPLVPVRSMLTARPPTADAKLQKMHAPVAADAALAALSTVDEDDDDEGGCGAGSRRRWKANWPYFCALGRALAALLALMAAGAGVGAQVLGWVALMVVKNQQQLQLQQQQQLDLALGNGGELGAYAQGQWYARPPALGLSAAAWVVAAVAACVAGSRMGAVGRVGM
ncbi:uncharacterized protein LTHEOB_233 [Lasiodiplodia theobromae]|uniref:uncharacterized protein n=1 Tax=Lasiodiplodia theobromae TaxID=45133 RepID=UPI0015C39BA9|nr:uncharacterized protein LTHEOB_233 [Lasiodiplodia theobromae]KAF4543534.1 hypothetical protein LTHEOB_233 [Lasiodiplodia theobromae]